jgi:hypothetical protein
MKFALHPKPKPNIGATDGFNDAGQHFTDHRFQTSHRIKPFNQTDDQLQIGFILSQFAITHAQCLQRFCVIGVGSRHKAGTALSGVHSVGCIQLRTLSTASIGKRASVIIDNAPDAASRQITQWSSGQRGARLGVWLLSG